MILVIEFIVNDQEVVLAVLVGIVVAGLGHGLLDIKYISQRKNFYAKFLFLFFLIPVYKTSFNKHFFLYF